MPYQIKNYLGNRRPLLPTLLLVTVLILIAQTAGSKTAGAEALFGAETGTLAREPQITPADLGDGALEGLQYADPAAQLDLIEPPVADNFGDAQLEHLITIPAGRAGLEPSLALAYDSGAGAGWLGTGWDLSVGEIVVDTRFGVPRYLANEESESYLLDGDLLSPTAVVSDFADRVADRSDFTRRVEDEFERIKRHGNSPSNYFWEVTDKDGTVRYYGAMLDENNDYEPVLDPTAVQMDGQGNIFRWALTVEKDISNNTIVYDYERVQNVPIGAGAAALGQHLYLKNILYTGSIAAGVANDPAYQIRFLREGDVGTETDDFRKDIVVDARGGFIDVTADLLRRVEVRYGTPVNNGNTARTSWNTLVRAYDLSYDVNAPFGKSLLTSIDQMDANNDLVGSHNFGYYDEVTDGNNNYDGLSTPNNEQGWTPGDDSLERNLFNTFEVSALGGSETSSGDVHAYFGFNLAAPSKTGSVGGAFSVDFSSTEGLVEFIDINGDLLPDKVFRDSLSGPVQYRLNQSGPNGSRTFGPVMNVVNLNDLSAEESVGFAGGPEAYLGVAVQFSIAGDIVYGREYFEDVNNDGLPDFVKDGTVYFNRLVNGIPTFDPSSDGTAVPIYESTAVLPDLPIFEELEQQQRNQTVVVDTVRRWVAPFNGTVSVSGDVTLTPPPDAPSVDGVRVAIQKNDSELWNTTITTPNSAVSPTGVNNIAVLKGDALYFRVGSIDDGAGDTVQWDPVITYTHDDDSDPNGLSQKVYTASSDFTLAGRPDTVINMPFDGTVQLLGDLTKGVTTDDITVEVLLNGSVQYTNVITRGFSGVETIDTSFNVSGPVGNAFDEVIVRVRTDTPIDVTQIDWTPRLFYTSATKPDGTAINVGNVPSDPNIELPLVWDIEIYDQNNATSPQLGWTADYTGTLQITGGFNFAEGGTQGNFFLSVKGTDGTFEKTVVTVPTMYSNPFEPFAVGTLNFSVVGGETYWFELTTRDKELVTRISNPRVVRGTDWALINMGTLTLPSTYHTIGDQNVFPIPYRGWGYAGYNANGRVSDPLVENAFILEQDDFEQGQPSGFNDANYQNPAEGDAYVYVPIAREDGTKVWQGLKENLAGGADFASASRSGADSIDISLPGGGNVHGVVKIGSSGPIFGIVAGIGPANVAAAGGTSRGVVDYIDLNGDAYPDVVAPGYVQYTSPRGGYLDIGNPSFDNVALDSSVAIGAGFGGSAIEISGNSEGQANSAQDVATTSGNADRGGGSSGSSAGSGEQASGDEYGASLGASVSIDAAFTNPALETFPSDWGPILAVIEGGLLDGLNYEQEYADINGDDLPDRVLVSTAGVFVQLNLGYSFSTPFQWSTGGFEFNESYAGGLDPGLGFSINNKEFSGGIGYSQSIDLSRYSWIDVDGDGVLDRLHKTNDGIMVAFGTGAGLLSEVEYGTFQTGSFDLLNDLAKIPTGQSIAQGESNGIGGGFDFTIGIGPLCIGGCYVIVNPGAHFETAVSSNQVQFIDINGDGYPDSVKSQADDDLSVFTNNRGKTNLLSTVGNPIGGQIRLGYTLDGNTTSQPYPIWTMTSVEVDDGRSGDGYDTLLTTYSYQNNAFDSLEREFLGYATVIEENREYRADGDVTNDPLLRQTVRTYRNGSVFDAGLLESETLQKPDGTWLKRTVQTWQMVDISTGTPVSVPTISNRDSADFLLAFSASPQIISIENFFYDDNGNLGQATEQTFQYDTRGNIILQVDKGELETTADDLRAITTYSQCPVSGVSVPATFEVQDSAGNTLRKRDGSPDLCLNAVPIQVTEWINDSETAVTEMTFDAWGSYNSVTYPENETGQRFRVDYVYDSDRHTDVVRVEDSYELIATASFDGPTGQILSRTDANGQTTSYTYDAFGRPATITGVYEQGTSDVTVTFSYSPTDKIDGYSFATAEHYDAFNPGNTIDTVAFIDGIGRETQRKQDGTIFNGANSAASDMMIVEGAVEFDALWRPIKEWYPLTEPLGQIGVYNTEAEPFDNPIETTWDLQDRLVLVKAPNGNTISTAYGFGSDNQILGGATLFTTTVTDPLGKPITSWTDVRDNVLAIDDDPPTDALVRTRYSYSPLGELTQVIDPAGSVTTHSYDQLGRRLTTNTPNAGLLEQTWDPAGNLIAVVDPVLREINAHVDYDYDYTRLVAINYPDATPDVSYTYGGPNANNNGAGRVIALSDGARDQTFTYDPLGLVASETSIMQVHNLNPSTVDKHTYTTGFTYDGYGRRETIVYPDGEVVTHDYDSGGLLKSVTGEKTGNVYPYVTRLEYDQFFDRNYIAFGNGTDTVYTYEALSRRLSRILTNTPDREVQDLNYTYDAIGNVTQVVNDVPNPQPNQFVGPFTHDYTYDPYYRIVDASGEFEFAPNKKRTYDFVNRYDEDGNIAYKEQTDLIFNNPRKGIEQKPTTYTINFTYSTTKPNQLVETDERTYSYDAAGNYTGWDDKQTGQNRTASFDSENRMVLLADQGSTTVYTYDHANGLAIERGPGGELSFVNKWYTVENGSLPRKSIYAGNDQVVIKREMRNEQVEFKQYYQHKNLQGSTNIVTDDEALVFQNLIYFPSGEIWVHEKSNEFETPYRFAGGYFDEFREVINFGERWYDPRDQFFLSTDPILQDDPREVIDDPALLPAYTYAASNPVSLVDPNGRDNRIARDALTAVFLSFSKPNQPGVSQARFATNQEIALAELERGSRLWVPLVAFENSALAKSYQDFQERFELAAAIKINIDNGKISKVRVFKRNFRFDSADGAGDASGSPAALSGSSSGGESRVRLSNAPSSPAPPARAP